MRRLSIQLALIAAFLLTSCTQATAPDTRAADEAALRATDEEWSATAGKKDVDATVAFYADDAVVLPPNAPMTSERKTIRETWAAMLGPGSSISWKVSKVEVAKAGDLGYIYGTYQLTMADPRGAAVNDTGKFLEVWRKQADGKFKCIVDAFNSDLPLPAPLEPKKK